MTIGRLVITWTSPKNWRGIAKQGNRILAIKTPHDKNRKNKMTLTEARLIVDAWMQKKGLL